MALDQTTARDTALELVKTGLASNSFKLPSQTTSSGTAQARGTDDAVYLIKLITDLAASLQKLD